MISNWKKPFGFLLSKQTYFGIVSVNRVSGWQPLYCVFVLLIMFCFHVNGLLIIWLDGEAWPEKIIKIPKNVKQVPEISRPHKDF